MHERYLIAVTTKMSNGDMLDILTDRSQGTTKISKDVVEIMVHRRLFKDDHFGVSEALDEFAFGQPLVARGKHYLHRYSDQSI